MPVSLLNKRENTAPFLNPNIMDILCNEIFVYLKRILDSSII